MNDELQNIWTQALHFIQEEMQELFYNTYILPIKPISLTSDTICFEVPHEFLVSTIESKYYPTIRNSIIRATKKEFKLHFYLPGQFTATTPNVSSVTVSSFESHLINKYTFDSFIIGNSNRMAYAAAVAIADNPSTAYNPFFIYGDSGLGKTHLMHAIGNHIHSVSSQSKILYVSSETFTSEFIKAIEQKKNEEFRDKYRNIDVLLIDDIQFIAKKERTQEEFFFTFNALYQSNKQIIISSDRPPNEINILEDRLKTRFAWGLIADIQVPDFETKVAILKKKAKCENLVISENVYEYIAHLLGSNIRELEGALNRLVMYHSLTNVEITIETAKEALRHLQKNANVVITPPMIIDIVSRYFNITIDDMISSKRNRILSYPRQIAMFLCRDMTGLSLPKIGDAFGGRDHTTVMHAYDQVQIKIASSIEVKDCIDELKKNIKGY